MMDLPESMIILPSADPQTQEALRAGWLQNQRVLARGILNPQDGKSIKVIFERIPSDAKRPAGLNPWLKAIRAFSLTATFTPCLAVILISYFQNIPIRWPVAISSLLAVCFLQIATNIFNDIEDYRKLIDLPNTTGGSGVIQEGWWSLSQLRQMAWGALGFGVVTGFWPLYLEYHNLIGISLFAFFGVLGYSAKLFGLKYNSLGDVAVLLFCGPVLTVGFSIAIDGKYNETIILTGVYFGLLAMALLHVNNLQDMQLDFSRGISTLAIKMGFRKAKTFLYSLYVASYLILIYMVGTKDLPKVSLLALVIESLILWPLLKGLYAASGPHSQSLYQSRIKAAQVHLASGLGLCLSLVLGRFF